MMKLDCIFCRIISGNAPATFLHRDEVCSVFLDIQPINPGHLLVIPNSHAPHLADLREEQGGHLFRIAQRMAAALRRSGVRCEGVNLFLADGAVAMQEVFHVHLHVLPRDEGDGFGLQFPSRYSEKPTREELERVGASIRAHLTLGPDQV